MQMAKNVELMALIGKIKIKFGLNQAEIAKKLGVSRQYLSDVLNGRYPYNDELRKRFSDNFPKLDGEITSDVTEVTVQTSEPYTTNSFGVKYRKREDGQLLIQVPIIPYSALGSPSDEFTPPILDEDEYETEVFEVDRIGHGKYYAFRVDGDSMDDGTRRSFARGDVILARELDKAEWMPHLRINRWRFWVVAFGNNIRLKEIVAQDDATGDITLHSLNPSPEYTDFTLHLADVYRLFNVIRKNSRSEAY